jgi:hypothetical protein
MIKLNKRMVAINPEAGKRANFVLWFGGPYSADYALVWARSLDEALDELVDYIAEHAPGLLANEVANEAYKEAIAEGKTQDEAWEIMGQGLTSGGNCGDFIQSDEWGIVLERPTRAQIKDLISEVESRIY